MEYWGIIILLVGCWSLQIVLAMRQNKSYQQSLNDVKKHKEGHIGVGIARAKFNIGRGVVMIVVTDIEGRVIDLREMKGVTVFSKFQKNQNLIGQSVAILHQSFNKKRESLAFKQAVDLINQERNKQKLVSLELS